MLRELARKNCHKYFDELSLYQIVMEEPHNRAKSPSHYRFRAYAGFVIAILYAVFAVDKLLSGHFGSNIDLFFTALAIGFIPQSLYYLAFADAKQEYLNETKRLVVEDDRVADLFAKQMEHRESVAEHRASLAKSQRVEPTVPYAPGVIQQNAGPGIFDGMKIQGLRREIRQYHEKLASSMYSSTQKASFRASIQVAESKLRQLGA